MKNQISWMRDAALVLLILTLAGCMERVASNSEEAPAQAEVVAEAAPPDDLLVPSDPAPKDDVSHALATPVSNEITVPANVRPSPAMAEVLKLVNSGADEDALLQFIRHSTRTFNLGAEEIIYLTDVGVPPQVITAMLQRDHILQGLAAMPPEPVPAIESPLDNFDYPVPYPETQPSVLPIGYDTSSYADSVPPAPEPPAVALIFDDALAPYGSWMDVEGYGRCWQPTVVVENPGWQPYFDRGRWVYTNSGWYWMSDYSWGWAPFHYGRWFRHARLGWCWTPDTVWGPSWVCWRSTDDYCGWAPLPPGCRFTVAGGLSFQGTPCRPDFHFGLGSDCFRFVATGDFCRDQLSRHAVPRGQISRFYHRTVASTGMFVNNNNIVNGGVPRERIVAAVRREIPVVALREINSPATPTRDRFEANGRTMAVYRPHDLHSRPGHSAPAGVASQTGGTFSRHETLPSRPAQGTGTAAHSPAVGHHSTRTTPDYGSQSDQERPGAIIIHGSALRTSGRETGSTWNNQPHHDYSSATHQSQAAAWSGRTPVVQEPDPEPEVVQNPPRNSLIVIGRHGGQSSRTERSRIQVITTASPAPHNQLERPWEPTAQERPLPVNEAGYVSARGGNRHQEEQSAAARPVQPAHSAPERAQPRHEREAVASVPRQESPVNSRPHSEPNHHRPVEVQHSSPPPPVRHEPVHSAPAPPPPARESHAESRAAPSSPPPAQSPSSHSSSSHQEQSSSGRHR